MNSLLPHVLDGADLFEAYSKSILAMADDLQNRLREMGFSKVQAFARVDSSEGHPRLSIAPSGLGSDTWKSFAKLSDALAFIEEQRVAAPVEQLRQTLIEKTKTGSPEVLARIGKALDEDGAA